MDAQRAPEETASTGSPTANFDEHYRRVVLGAVLHAAESERAFRIALGHRRRAARAERSIDSIWRLIDRSPLRDPLPGRPQAPAIGAFEALAGIGWIAVAAALIAGLTIMGVHSWWTGAADIALIALTAALVALDARSRGRANSLPSGS